MAQSTRVLKELGSLVIQVDKRVSLGSSSELVPVYKPTATSFADADATVTVDQVKTGIFTMTPTTTRTLTLPTATLLSAYLDAVGKSVDVSVINLGADTTTVTVAAGSGGTLSGAGVVRDPSTTTNSDSGSGLFRIVMTNVSTPAYTVYRVC